MVESVTKGNLQNSVDRDLSARLDRKLFSRFGEGYRESGISHDAQELARTAEFGLINNCRFAFSDDRHNAAQIGESVARGLSDHRCGSHRSARIALARVLRTICLADDERNVAQSHFVQFTNHPESTVLLGEAEFEVDARAFSGQSGLLLATSSRFRHKPHDDEEQREQEEPSQHNDDEVGVLYDKGGHDNPLLALTARRFGSAGQGQQ